MLRYSTLYCAWLVLFLPLWLSAEETKDPPATRPSAVDSSGEQSVEQIVRQAKNSVCVITVADRDGIKQGLGTGFVVSTDGLIATNLHVIGEARPIAVQFADGRKYDVASVHASDRALDLALIRIKADGLVALALGDSDRIEQGQSVVVLGNPYGLKHSVVSGIISSKRQVEGREMIQLAIPIEPGNSGGPVLDRRGRVQGIVTMKSLISENLGFAMPINGLRRLLDKPNPVPMERWLTIGTLDAKQWSARFGARWQQRAGRILVSEPGRGFGGRSLCLWEHPLPKLPYEMAVSVRLDEESGAAGLVFHSDDADKHYGFYPSAGKVRLSRFEGPDVFAWTVLHDEPSEYYHPGEWNRLKVRFEDHKILCYVNDHLVIESTDDQLPSGKVGLAKFRETAAEFKEFRVAEKIAPLELVPDVVARLDAQIQKLPALEDLLPEQLAPLADDPSASARVLRGRAQALQRQAEHLRRLATDVHVHAVAAELGQLMKGPEEKIDLARGALWIARLDDDELDVDAYLAEIDRMAAVVSAKLPAGADEPSRLAALNDYLFTQNGFHGSRTDYYHRANSYLNRVIDDREGLPITLSVLYIELGRRIGVHLAGVNLPGHFVVRHVPAKGEGPLIDVFDGGRTLSREDAAAKVMTLSGEPLREENLHVSDKRSILRRMLANLLRLAQAANEKERMLGYLEALVAIDPQAVADRGMRAVVRFETGRRAAAVSDLDWLLENKPAGLDLEQLRQMRDYFQQAPRAAE